MNKDELSPQAMDAAKRGVLIGWGQTEDVVVARGEGARFWDVKGKEYIDCTSQAWSLNTGFNQPRVMKAAKEQIDRVCHVRNTFYQMPQLQLVRKLAEIAPGEGDAKLTRSSFTLHGSLATETAMKLALKYRPDGSFMTLYNGYHGRTLGSMALSWPHPHSDFLTYTGNVVRVPGAYCYRCSFGLQYPQCNLQCADFIEEAISKNSHRPISALVMEPIQGNGGQVTFPDEFHTRMRQICDQHGLLLIYDEVQTGFARVPAMFCCQLYDVVPDIIIFGKAIGGGFPLAGTLSRPGLPGFAPGDHGFTFDQFPPSLAAALANIQVIEEENLLDRCQELEDRILGRLREMQQQYEIIGDIRGRGLMIGIELVKDRATKEPAREQTTELVEKAMERGVLFGSSLYAGLGNVVKIKPPAVITNEEIDRALDVFEELTREMN